jgi:hypothetical protein
MIMMSKAKLVEAGYEIIGGNIKDLSSDQLQRLITVAQYVTDLCVNEMEQRGELLFFGELPALPYRCDYVVETVFTRLRDQTAPKHPPGTDHI